MKIDVEGHEQALINGARVTLQRDRPILLIEVSGDPDESGSSAAVLLADLRDIGYGAYRLDNGVLAAREAGDRRVNYFFLTDEQFERYRAGRTAA